MVNDSDREFEEKVNRSYCDKLAEILLAYELDPRNFLKSMRALQRHPTSPSPSYNTYGRPR